MTQPARPDLARTLSANDLVRPGPIPPGALAHAAVSNLAEIRFLRVAR